MNVTISILKQYGIQSIYPSIAVLDKELEKNYKNIVYILIDALGDSILKRHSDVAQSLIKDQISTITSVFPPTTVAATTSVLTGLQPIETGWLGWCQYVKEENKNVIFFTNKDYYDDKTVFNYNVSEKNVPVQKIYELIEQANLDVSTREIFPAFRDANHDSFLKQCKTIIETCQEKGKHFIYTYWDKLDTYMHEFGPGSVEAHKMLDSINKGYEYLKDKIDEDTMIILIADHGQIDVLPIEFRKYTDLWNTFVHEPSVESRATAFFIKENKKDEFERLFNNYFREYFVLYKTEEVIKMNLFGVGKEHPKFREFLGDYFAIATDNYYFKMDKSNFRMKGQHSGLLSEEMIVPLIMFSKKKEA